jgi:hypothetical protein
MYIHIYTHTDYTYIQTYILHTYIYNISNIERERERASSLVIIGRHKARPFVSQSFALAAACTAWPGTCHTAGYRTCQSSRSGSRSGMSALFPRRESGPSPAPQEQSLGSSANARAPLPTRWPREPPHHPVHRPQLRESGSVREQRRRSVEGRIEEQTPSGLHQRIGVDAPIARSLGEQPLGRIPQAIVGPNTVQQLDSVTTHCHPFTALRNNDTGSAQV